MFGRRILCSLVLATCVLLVPTAAAWTLPASTPDPDVPPPIAAWTLDLLPATGPRAGADAAHQSVACALADVNKDDAFDLVVQMKANATSPPRLVALAGPDFQRPLWEIATRADRVLQCAPDLNRDGIGDPVAVIMSKASGSAGATSAAGRNVDRAMQVLDGLSGEVLIKRQHKDTNQGTKAGTVSASSNATANLLPASAGAEALLKTDVQQSMLTSLPSQLPVGQLTTTARSAAEMTLLNAQGTVEGVIKIDQPGVDPLAIAPVPVGAGLPDVSVLTAKAVSPVQEATQRVPTLSRYNPDGTLAWARELNGTQGLPVLVPRAGDLDMDGVQDMIVENVPMGVAAQATSRFQVLSGIDGTQLLGSGVPVTGLAAALPLGRLPNGLPGILSVAQAQGAATMTLSALDVNGKVAWTTQLDAGAIPINVRPDAYTGDPLGFTDLTGDMLPDVAVATRSGADIVVKTINGADGKLAWEQRLQDVDRLVPSSPLSTLDQIRSNASSVRSDILAIGDQTKGIGMRLLDGTTGAVIWSLKGQLPTGAAHVAVDVQAAGDLNADGVQDVLATVTRMAQGARTGHWESASSDATGGDAVYAISGSNGSTIWSNATDGSGAAPELTAEKGPGYEERAEALQETDSKKGAPAPGALLVVVAVAATMLVRRRR